MRAATLFNFLLEATLMGSVMILIQLLVRRFLRRQLGNRILCVAWLLIAVRLLLPVSIPNPLMNELRPTYSSNLGVRPIADQVRVRFMDAASEAAWAIRIDAPYASDAIHRFGAETSYGHTARWVALAYGGVALLVLGYMVAKNAAFMRKLKKSRVNPLAQELHEAYLAQCKALNVKPVPVFWVDPLPSACVVGVFRPYIALPLSLKPEELELVFAHELSHVKAWDTWWVALYNLCCAVHWFNPLVWLAARLSRNDRELACDGRVTTLLNDERRMAYANTLALAVSKKNTPELSILATGMTMKGRHMKQRILAIVNQQRIVKWLSIAALCVACAGLLFSFATAELLPTLPMPAVEPLQGETAALRSIQTPEEAAAYAREFFNAPGVMADPGGLDYNATENAKGGWQVRASVPGKEYPHYLILDFDRSGRITNFHNPMIDDGVSYQRAKPSYAQEPDKGAPYVDYIRSFASVMLPGIGPLEPLYIDADSIGEGTRQLSLRYGEYGEKGFIGGSFTLRIEPDIRVIDFFVFPNLDEVDSASALPQLEPVAELGGNAVSFAQMLQGSLSEDERAAIVSALSGLTEVFGYTQPDAEAFIGQLVTEGNSIKVACHAPERPEWIYQFIAEHSSYMLSPFATSYTGYQGEGGFRGFWYAVEESGWLAAWDENARRAFVDSFLSPAHGMVLEPDVQQAILNGSLSPAQAVQACFEANYGPTELWSHAHAQWRDDELARFGLEK